MLRKPSSTSKYSEGCGFAPTFQIRFIPIAIAEFGARDGHATDYSTKLAKHAAASKGIHMGKLLAS
jgi:hypothetical protein